MNRIVIITFQALISYLFRETALYVFYSHPEKPLVSQLMGPPEFMPLRSVGPPSRGRGPSIKKFYVGTFALGGENRSMAPAARRARRSAPAPPPPPPSSPAGDRTKRARCFDRTDGMRG